MKSVGILGVGEVGLAILSLAKKNFEVYVRDLDKDTLTGKTVEVLNVCIPYSTKFEGIVVSLIKEVRPKLVVIHATVKPGTTRNIYKKTKVAIAHTPIMGVHPHLAKYQTQFTKMIGAIDDKSYKLTMAYWKKLGATKIIRFDGPEETELGKILSTTYYGWNIIFNKMAKLATQETKTNFDQVYTKFNEVYNDGYARTKPNVRRPILKYMPGEIGGHCVIPNAEIMKKENKLFDWLLKFNKILSNDK